MHLPNRWIYPLLAVVAAMPATVAAQSDNVFAPERIGRWYLSGALGGFKEETNSQLTAQDGRFGFAVSGGYRLTPYIALEADVLFARQEFDTPSTIPAASLGTLDARSDLDTGGVGGIAKFILPLDRVELYAGGGLGLYKTTLRITGTLLGAPTKLEDDDTDVGYQVLLGADFFVTRRVSVGLEYRKLKLDADFGSIIPGKLDTGGDFFLATVRGHF